VSSSESAGLGRFANWFGDRAKEWVEALTGEKVTAKH